jgi:hypothetical protein
MLAMKSAEQARVDAMNALLKEVPPGGALSPESTTALDALTQVGVLSGLPINEQTRVNAINALLNTSPPGTPNSPEITAAIVALTDLGVQAN